MIVIGVAPFLVQDFVFMVAKAVIGGVGELEVKYIKIWHGLVPALFMSIAAVVGGLILYVFQRSLQKAWDNTPRPEAKTIFEAIIAAVVALAQRIIHPTHDGAFTRYAMIMLGFVTLAGYYLSLIHI